MADPITWGLLNLIKKRVKGVQTTLDGVSDKVSGLPDSLDADFTEVKEAIADVKVDVGNVNTAVGGVKEDTTSIKSTVVNSTILNKDSVVKSVQRGEQQVQINKNSTVTAVEISPVSLDKSLLLVSFVDGSDNITYRFNLTSNSIQASIGVSNLNYVTIKFCWQVIEFY